jgi:hypothetical protein
MTFDLFADGVDEIHQVFASAAAAKTYFTNHAFTLGSLSTGALSGGTLTLKAVLSVTSATVGAGFYGDIIVGDPPSAGPATHRFVQAAAGFGGRGGELALAAPVELRPPCPIPLAIGRGG